MNDIVATDIIRVVSGILRRKQEAVRAIVVRLTICHQRQLFK